MAKKTVLRTLAWLALGLSVPAWLWMFVNLMVAVHYGGWDMVAVVILVVTTVVLLAIDVFLVRYLRRQSGASNAFEAAATVAALVVLGVFAIAVTSRMRKPFAMAVGRG